jgi:Tol biopolymer transport system component
MGIWRIAGRRSAPADRMPQRLIGSNWWDSHPAYSPDGRKIAFQSDRSGVGSIWLSDDRGRDPAQLTTLQASGTPRWSPDGRQIVFDSLEAGNSDIYVTEVEGGIPRRLTIDPASDNVGTFSRDGRSIYFHSDRSGAIEVWRIPSAGGPAVQVTRGGGLAAQESWDGRHVYFARFAGGQTSIRRAPVDGGEDTEVMRGPSGWDAWAVAASGIYFLDSRQVLRGRKSETTIAFFDLESGRTLPIFRREEAILNYGISVSPDEQWILFGEYPFPQSELMLVENFR